MSSLKYSNGSFPALQAGNLEGLPPLEVIREELKRRRATLEASKDLEGSRSRCRTLAGFVKEAWHVLEPEAKLVWGWHLDAICQHLEAVTFGRINRLLINVPPGSLKSLLVSVFWPAWEWSMGFRSLRYLATAFNEGPVKRDTRKTRDLILSAWYQARWPEVRLVRTAETSYANADTGSREGVAFGSLTSQRGDRLIIDDPHSTDTAESDLERMRTTRRFREGALSRLNDQVKSAIVVIMQRLHTDDISGIIQLLKMGFVHLMLPMEFEPDRRCITYVDGKEFFRDPRQYDGELLEPQRLGAEAVQKLKSNMTAFAWAGQYQQRPTPREGGLFQRDWFEIVEKAPKGTKWCRGWDLAATKQSTISARGPAWTAGVKLGYHPATKTFYVGHVARKRGTPAEIERLIKTVAESDGPEVRISIPQDPGQAGVAQRDAYAKLLVGYSVRFSPESGDKEERADPVAAQAEVGNVKLIKGPWNDAFLEEVGLFPGSSFKDQVDGMSRAFGELLKSRSVPVVAPVIVS